jgi:F-type H+-transporting ATPase subunit gamma
MPALVDIRRRIRSVKNTQQITKAMKMVAAARLRRAQEAMFAARPYARKMMEVLNSLASRANPDAHPLLQQRTGNRTLLLIVTADKGLAGGFNANIIRAAVRFLEEKKGATCASTSWARRGATSSAAGSTRSATNTSASSPRCASRWPRASRSSSSTPT